MDLFNLFCKISLDPSDFEQGLENAKKKMDSFASGVKTFKSGLESIEKGFKAVEGVGQKAVDVVEKGLQSFSVFSTVIGGIGASAVKAGAEFDATMSTVSALSGKVRDEDLPGIIETAKAMGLTFKETGDATSTAMDILRNKAIEMGEKTSFSAKEAADAMTYMGMAGWKTQDMLGGIAGIMDLAAASGEDLATTSDIVTDALTAFGMTAADSGRFADVLAVAATNANTDVGMMGETFKYVAPVMGGVGYTVEDAALAIGLMANSSIKASQAGTSLRTIITRLSTDAGASKYKLGALGVLTKELGVEFYNTDGSARSLNDVLMDSRKAWAGLSAEQQINYANTIAGQEAISGWLAIMNATDEDVEKLTLAIDDCNGAASEMAAIKLDNLAGDVKLLESAFGTLQIVISDALTPTLREFAQFGAEAIKTLTKALREDGFHGMASALTDVVSNAVHFLSEQAPKFAEVSMDFMLALGEGLINSADDILTAAREIASTLVTGLTGFIQEHGPEIVKIGMDIIEFISDGFGVFDIFLPLISDFITVIASGFATHAQELFMTGVEVITTIIDGIAQHIEEIREIAGNFVTNIVEGIRANAPALIEGGIIIITNLLEEIANQLPQVLEAGIEIVSMLLQGIADNLPRILDAAGEIIGGLVQGITQALPQIAEAAIAIIQKFAEYIRENLPTIIETGLQLLMEFSASLRENVGLIIDAAIDLMVALAQGLADGLPAIIEYVPEIISNIANIINDNAPKIIEAGVQIIAALVVGLIKAIPTLIVNVPKIISAIVDVITAFNWIDLGGKIVKGLIEGIKALLGDVKTVAKTIVSNITTVLQDLPGYLKAIGQDVIKGLIEGIKSGFGFIKENLMKLVELVVGTVKDLLGIHSPSTVFLEIGGNIVQGLLDGISGAWDAVTSFFKDGVKNIISTFDGIKEKFVTIGKNIVDGIKDGISNAWSAFTSWLGGKVSGIVDAVKGMLGIHSPSKVFAGIGENMALGLAEGWDDEYSSIKKQIEDGLTFAPATVGVNASAPSYASGAPGGAGAVGNAPTGGNTYVTINSPVAVDAVQAAREWKKTSQRVSLGLV